MPVKKGDKVKVEYKGTLEDGTEFDSSEKHGHPLEFEVGSGQLIKGFDEGVIGMEKGDEKDIKLKPEEAYGAPREELIRDIPKEHLPKEQEPKVGMMLLMATKEGQQIPAKIVEVTEKTIKVDLNHPLAGKVLNFHVKVVEINS